MHPLRGRRRRRPRHLRPPRHRARRVRRTPRHRGQPALLPVDDPAAVPGDRRRAWATPGSPRSRRGRSAGSSIEKPFGHDLESAAGARRHASTPCSPSTRSSASTTTSPRRRCRTSWRCASRTRSSSRSGTAATSTTSRSPSPSSSASSTAGTFYEQAGALRDIVQNHVLQVLALIAMEPPASLRGRPGARREGEGAAVDPTRSTLQDCRSVVVRGQYDGRRRSTASRCSATATRKASRRQHDRDLPRAPPRDRQLAVGRRAVLRPHRQAPPEARHRGRAALQAGAVPPVADQRAIDSVEPNTTVLRIQPDEGIEVSFAAKVPGLAVPGAHRRRSTSPTASVRRAAARGVRAGALRRAAGRRDAVHPRATRSIRRGASCSRSIDAFAAGTRARCTSTRPGAGAPEIANDLFDDPDDRWRQP